MHKIHGDFVHRMHTFTLYSLLLVEMDVACKTHMRIFKLRTRGTDIDMEEKINLAG
jgi:hypothetical protein